MHSVFIALAVLACPLGMAAMGGAAWVGGKLWSRSAEDRDQSLRQPQGTS